MRATGRAWLIAAMAVLSTASVASAQTQLWGKNVEGEVEAGGRIFLDRPSKSSEAKFEEYRDVPAGPFLDRLRLRIFNPDESYSAEIGGAWWGQDDQEYSLRAGRLGLWEFEFQWDQIPHVFSTNARTLQTEAARGVFTLPTPRPAPLSLHNLGRDLDEISTRWDTARMSLSLTPTPWLDFKAEYTRIRKDGDKPLSIAFGSPGNNFADVLEPIEQTVHDFRLRGSFVGDNYQVQFGYILSLFQNDLDSLTADNPCFGLAAALPAGCGASDGAAAAPSRGRISLAPDNMAHTFNLSGGFNLPFWRTRVNANFSYGLRIQDENFLPHTINPALVSPALALPQTSLNGFVQTILFNFTATSRPLPPLTLTLKYRIFDFNDQSDEPVFDAFAINDRSITAEPRRAGRYEYTKQNAELEARWRIAPPAAFTVGAGWERWDRNEHREVPTSDEYFARAAFDWTPTDWLLFRATYMPSFRRIDEYNTFAHLEHSVIEEDISSITAQSQSTLLRKFDEAARNRQRFDVLLQITPIETFTISPTGSYRFDDYIDSAFGLQRATTWSAGVDFNWMPLERLSVFGGYVHERIDQRQRSRSREVVSGMTLDFPDFEWVSRNEDTVDTFRLGVSTALIPKTLDWSVTASYETALGRVETQNPIRPTSGTAAQNASATAKVFPAFRDSLFRLDSALKYRFLKVWTLKLGYAFERFEKRDFRTDGLDPFVPGLSSIFFGNDLKNYTAHIIALTVGYRFK